MICIWLYIASISQKNTPVKRRMRRFYHFHREKRSVRSPNPLRAPAQSTAFSNRRFNRRAAQNRSSSDSTQTHLQNHAASASQLSTYKASCAGFTTLLRFGIKPCAALNSHASAQTYFKKHRRTKPLSLRFRASPATLCHPAHPAPDSPHSFALHQIPQSPYNARQSAPALPHARGIAARPERRRTKKPPHPIGCGG